jgi:hypothetical protein
MSQQVVTRGIGLRRRIARCSTAVQRSLMHRLLEPAKRLEQMSTPLRFALWIAQARDFAPTKMKAKRQIDQLRFVWRQVAPRESAPSELASNQTAAQAM